MRPGDRVLVPFMAGEDLDFREGHRHRHGLGYVRTQLGEPSVRGRFPFSEADTEAPGSIEFDRPRDYTLPVERGGVLGRIAVGAAEFAGVGQRDGQANLAR